MTGKCARRTCPGKARPGRNRGLCSAHYDAAPDRGYVDPSAARARLALLRSLGVTIDMLGEYGLSQTGVRRVQTAARIRRLTEAKVFTVPIPPGLVSSSADVDGTGTRRRIQAMAAMGWSTSEIGARIGSPQNGVSAIAKRDRVTAETAAAVREAFAELGMTPGPSEICRARARAKGWVTGAAWDDIDNPDEVPQGVGSSRGSFVDRYQDARQHAGVSDLGKLAELLQMEPKSVKRQVTRHRALLEAS